MLLWATGRTGNAVLRQLSEFENITITPAIRHNGDISKLPKTKRSFQTQIVNIDSISSHCTALEKVDIIINAIRLRGNICPDALVDLDKRIRSAANFYNRVPFIITVGGAGSLNMHNGRYF